MNQAVEAECERIQRDRVRMGEVPNGPIVIVDGSLRRIDLSTGANEAVNADTTTNTRVDGE